MIILMIWLLVIPSVIGFAASFGMEKKERVLPFFWISGQMILWAVFQVICVPLILKEKSLSLAIWIFQILVAILMAASIVCLILYFRKKKKTFKVVKDTDKVYTALWIGFWALLVFQMIMTVVMTYGDGDDAYYVAVSTASEKNDLMYLNIPYTGDVTTLDVRHALAPFPMWIAALARVSKVSTVMVAHVMIPLALIPMTYGIYYLIGKKILGKKDKKGLPLFMIMIECLILFGDYSSRSPENFLIARTRQGKAALGNLIFPMLIYLLLLLLQRIQDGKKPEWNLWLLLVSVVTAACLCSTLGAFLVCLLIGVVGISGAICYRKIRFLLPMALCCIPAVVYSVLYQLGK